MKSIKIEYGKLGYILYVNGLKVNFSDSEFENVTTLRKYWNKHRNALILGRRHSDLYSFLYAHQL